MNELLQTMMVLLAGMLIGGVFFGGLWWTVQKGVTARQPALWFGLSLLLRSCVTLGGFYLVAGSDWRRLLVCLFGFMLSRLIVTRLAAMHMAGEASHAP